MAPARIAIVGRDPGLRLQAAEAFDEAPAEWAVALFEEVPEGADAVVVCPDVEAEGIPFDARDPAGTLDRVAAALARGSTGRLFFVTSASGGSGVTTVALHLAALLGRRGRACYLELSPDAGGRARLGWSDAPDWADVHEEGSLLDAARPASGGFRALLAPDGEVEAGRGVEVLALCRAAFSFVVVDGGAACVTDEMLRTSSTAIGVVPPTVPGGRRAAQLVARYPMGHWALVVNRTGPGSRLTSAALRSLLGRRIAVELPCNPRLRDAEDDGTFLLDRWTRWTQRLDSLAGALVRL